MSRKTTEVIETFQAQSDDGQLFDIVVTQVFITTRTLDGNTHRTPGLKDARTAEGDDCNLIEDGVFEILLPGSTLRVTRI